MKLKDLKNIIEDLDECLYIVRQVEIDEITHSIYISKLLKE